MAAARRLSIDGAQHDAMIRIEKARLLALGVERAAGCGIMGVQSANDGNKLR